MSFFYVFSFFAFCLASISLIIYFVFKRREDCKKSANNESKITNPQELVNLTHSTNQEEESFNSTSTELLEEAITLAIADGKLNKQEEVILRKQAILVGKDPDELIDQLKEDVFGDEKSETEEILRPGLTFEKFVLQLFNPRFFRIDHWLGDKVIAGRYSKTAVDPDIQITINTDEGRFPLAVKCKWRTQRTGEYISFAEDKQLKSYQQFSKETGKPTFIVLGLGGQPSKPQEMYLIPVQDFKSGTQHHASLAHYRKPNPEQGFFFDVESTRLM